jgi:hypothetical protein
MTTCDLESVRWTSRTIPVGTENPIDIATLTFNVPIWISSPAMVKKLGVVDQIITNIFDAQGDAVNAITNNDLLLGTRPSFAPWSYQVLLINNKLQALRPPQTVDNEDTLDPPDSPQSNVMWHSVIGAYGVLRPGISLIKLEQEDGSEVIGTIAYDPTDDRFLLFSIDEDTVPANTIGPVDAVINPLVSGPNAGLPAPAEGQRYLLTESTGDWSNHQNPTAWSGTLNQPLVAQTNDIIEYHEGQWIVVANSTSIQQSTQYVTNITTGIQYKWNGEMWVKSYQGLYPGGKWTIVL